MKVPFIELARLQHDRWTKPVDRVVHSGRYINGPELDAFEASFAAYCGTAACVGTGNGTDALEIALRATGVSAGDEVATVANAGMYSTVAIRAIGAIPVFVDVDDRTLLMSPEALREVIQPRTRAVVVTHLYGALAPIEELMEIAESGGAVVIEDCSQAHGAQRNGKRAGNWGIAGCFSFYPTKNLGALGDAGCIVTSDTALANRARALREYGWETRFHSSVPGGRNSRMDEIQAAVLDAKLPWLDHWNQRRRAIATRYAEALSGLSTLRLIYSAGSDFVAHLVVVQSPYRDRLKQRLESKGIQTQIHYPVPDHLQRSQAGQPFRAGSLANSERAAREVLSLPCYPELTAEELEYVVRSLIESYDELR